MEPPAGSDATTLKDAKYAVLRSIADADPKHYARGQSEGYCDINGVADDSTTETYAALRLEIDNWRWAGVPFFIRTGKCLAVKSTEVRLVFKHPPRLAFISGEKRKKRPEPDQLVVRLDPSTGVRMTLDALRADRAGPAPIFLDMQFAHEGGEAPTPYENLLHAALEGDATPFTRQDAVEESWRIVQPLLDAPPPVETYAKGSMGPHGAERLVAGHGTWHEPWVSG
jgi:glucose-6-phosphate 1-dehydrogenase